MTHLDRLVQAGMDAYRKAGDALGDTHAALPQQLRYSLGSIAEEWAAAEKSVQEANGKIAYALDLIREALGHREGVYAVKELVDSILCLQEASEERGKARDQLEKELELAQSDALTATARLADERETWTAEATRYAEERGRLRLLVRDLSLMLGDEMRRNSSR